MLTVRRCFVLLSWSAVLSCGGKVDFVAVQGGGGASTTATGAGGTITAVTSGTTNVAGTGGFNTSAVTTNGVTTSGQGTGGVFSTTSNTAVATTSGPSATSGFVSAVSTGPDFDGGIPISCGGQTCDGNSQQCCVSQMGPSCIDKNANCQGATLTCTGSSSCMNGDKCCAKLMGGAPKAACAPSCGGGNGNFQLCDSDMDCTPPVKCNMIFDGISICGGAGLGGP